MINERLLPQPEQTAQAANTFASENFNTVLYTGNGSTQRIGGYINRGATGFAYNKYITFPDMGGFTSNTSDSDGALSIWINFDSIPASSSNYHTIIDRGNPNSYSSTYQALELLAFGTSNTNEVEFRFRRGFGGTNYDASSYTSARATVAVGTWYNLVVSYVASTKTATFYLNSSTAIGSYSLTSAAGGRTIDSGFNLGSYANTSSYSAYAWFGKFDQFRIFNKALSTSEVATLNGETHSSTTISTTDIFNDNSGVALYQFDGNANDTGGVSGKYGAAAHFNGSSSYISTSNPLGTGNVAYSVSAWVYLNTSSHTAGIYTIWNGGTTAGTYLFFKVEGGKISIGNYGSSVTSVNTLSVGQWVHVAVTRDTSNNVVLYVNGSSDTTGTLSLNLGNHSPKIGALNTTTQNLNGKLDDVRIYSDVLTSTEVGYIYNNTTASIPTDNLEAYYKLDGDARDEQQLYDGTASNVTYAYDGTASNVTYQEATKFTPDLIWFKSRTASRAHALVDSVRGRSNVIWANLYDVSATSGTSNDLISFDSNGFTVGAVQQAGSINANGDNIVAWCFNAGTDAAALNEQGSIDSTVKANQDAGFSIVTYSGNSASSATIGHGLSSAPELIITKARNLAAGWPTMVKTSSTSLYGLRLNTNGANDAANGSIFYNNTAPTDSVYTVGTSDETNDGYNYVSYCFHSVDGYQKIGSYTSDGSDGDVFVDTGFQPAFLMIKNVDSGHDWMIYDNKRDTTNLRDSKLSPNSNGAEYSATSIGIDFASDGFVIRGTDDAINDTSEDFIYLAIAADPDETTPTVENSFDVVTYEGTGAAQDLQFDMKPDLIWLKDRDGADNHQFYDTIRGVGKAIYSNLTSAQTTQSQGVTAFNDDGVSIGTETGINRSGNSFVAWGFKAGSHDDNLPEINTEGDIDSTVSVNDAAGFSIVKYTGNGGSGQSVGHGLSSAPEMVIFKRTNASVNWYVFVKVGGVYKRFEGLNTTNAATSVSSFSASSTTITWSGTPSDFNGNGNEYIMYCWYSVTGHSKIGSYTGTGTAGNAVTTGFRPRFVMYKNTGAATNWVIVDSVRGAGTSGKYLNPNTSGAEGTYTIMDFTDTGFTLQDTDNTTNGNGSTYLYLAIK